MGGSLGGLTAALWLRDAGCEIRVYERSRAPLEGLGAGIVLHPATARYFVQHRILSREPGEWATRYPSGSTGSLTVLSSERRIRLSRNLRASLTSRRPFGRIGLTPEPDGG